MLLSLAREASARLPALAQAARAAEAFAENATRQGVALQELVEGLSNVSGHLEASSHTWRATADWMPWAVGLWSSLVVVAALVAAAAACWAGKPRRMAMEVGGTPVDIYRIPSKSLSNYIYIY